jgi:hypothetical protein
MSEIASQRVIEAVDSIGQRAAPSLALPGPEPEVLMEGAERSFLRTGSGLWIPGSSVDEDRVDPGEWRVDVASPAPGALRRFIEAGDRRPRSLRDFLPFIAATGIGLAGALLIFDLADVFEGSPVESTLGAREVPHECPATILLPGNDGHHVQQTFAEIRERSRSWHRELASLEATLTRVGLTAHRMEFTSGDLLRRAQPRVLVDAAGSGGPASQFPATLEGSDLHVTRVTQRRIQGRPVELVRISLEARPRRAGGGVD